MLKILRQTAFENGKIKGDAVAKQFPKRDFHSYNERFRNLSGTMNELITYDIIKDTEKAFEIKVTECVVVEVYIDAGIGKYADAFLCHEDFGHAEGFNPKIKLVRDKTLTSGHKYCDHRYVWKG